MPGFVNAHSHIEYAVYAGFGDGLPFVPWIGIHIAAQGGARRSTTWSTIATVGGARVPAVGGDDDRGLQLLGRGRRSPRRRAGLRAIVYLEVFSSDGPALERFHESRGRIERRALRPRAPRRLPACAVHLHDRDLPRVRRARPAAGDPLRRERRGARLAGRRHGGLEPAGGVPRAASGETGIRMLAAAGLLGPGLMAAHCVHADDEEIDAPRPARRRRRALPPLERLPRLRRRTARGSFATPAWPCRSRPTAPHRPRRSTCSRRSERRSSAPAPVSGRPDALTAADALELATLGGARVLGMDDRIGSLVPGKQADLAVISLVNSPFDPVEDPVTAAVLGGSPDRVTATLVAGEQRYLKGTSRWPDSTRAARSARSRMLP